MPQPLSRVLPGAVFAPNSGVLDMKPEFATLVSSIFAYWAQIEHGLSLLLVRVLGADAHPAIAMFSTLTAPRLQMTALEAAAEAALTPEEFEAFLATLAVAERVQTPRNHLAHWIWGYCDKLPDALLLADPKAQKERDRDLMLFLERSDEINKVNIAEFLKGGLYDPATVQVYRRSDLERALRDIKEGFEITYELCAYLDGIFRGRRKIPSNVN